MEKTAPSPIKIYPICIYSHTWQKIYINNRKCISIFWNLGCRILTYLFTVLSLKCFYFLWMNSKWIIVQCLIDIIDKMYACKSRFLYRSVCVKKGVYCNLWIKMCWTKARWAFLLSELCIILSMIWPLSSLSLYSPLSFVLSLFALLLLIHSISISL